MKMNSDTPPLQLDESDEKDQEKETLPEEQKYQELEKDYEQVKTIKDKNLDEYIDELENLLVKWSEVLEKEKDMLEKIKKKYENLRKSIREDLNTAYKKREEVGEKSERSENLNEEEIIAKERYSQGAEKKEQKEKIGLKKEFTEEYEKALMDIKESGILIKKKEGESLTQKEQEKWERFKTLFRKKKEAEEGIEELNKTLNEIKVAVGHFEAQKKEGLPQDFVVNYENIAKEIKESGIPEKLAKEEKLTLNEKSLLKEFQDIEATRKFLMGEPIEPPKKEAKKKVNVEEEEITKTKEEKVPEAKEEIKIEKEGKAPEIKKEQEKKRDIGESEQMLSEALDKWADVKMKAMEFEGLKGVFKKKEKTKSLENLKKEEESLDEVIDEYISNTLRHMALKEGTEEAEKKAIELSKIIKDRIDRKLDMEKWRRQK